MKATFFVSIMLLSSIVYSQTWFEVGLKGGPGTTFLINKNYLNDAGFEHTITGTYFYGGKVGVNFGEANGVSLQVGRTLVQQKFRNNYNSPDFNESHFKSNVLDLGLLYHRTKDAGYVEFGPRYSIVQTGDYSTDGIAGIGMGSGLNDSYFGVDLGFGSFLIGNERLTLMTGLRLSYGVTSILKDDRNIAPSAAVYNERHNVNVFAAMFCLELNYSLGYLVTSSCGRRTSWLSF